MFSISSFISVFYSGYDKTIVEKISWRCVTFQRYFVEEHCGENNYVCIEKDTLSIPRMKQDLNFMLHHSKVILLSRLPRYLILFSVYIEFCTINLFRDQIIFSKLLKKKNNDYFDSCRFLMSLLKAS